MEIIYYTSGILMPLVLITLLIVMVYFLIKPHALNKNKHITKPVSRPKIFIIGLLAIFVSLFSFSGIISATEPASVRQARAAEEAASTEAQQDKDAEEKRKREEEAKKPVVKTETRTEAIAFESIEEQDASLSQGQTRVAVEGVDGVRTITYEVTYVQDIETTRQQVKSEITQAPTTKVTRIGTYVAPPPTPAPAPQTSSNVYYRNCSAARAAGAAPVYVGEPGYASHLDRDGDGVGCE